MLTLPTWIVKIWLLINRAMTMVGIIFAWVYFIIADFFFKLLFPISAFFYWNLVRPIYMIFYNFNLWLLSLQAPEQDAPSFDLWLKIWAVLEPFFMWCYWAGKYLFYDIPFWIMYWITYIVMYIPNLIYMYLLKPVVDFIYWCIYYTLWFLIWVPTMLIMYW